MRNATIIDHVTTPVETASHPWSKSSPRGFAEPVLRACLPSRASRHWYKKRQRAAKINAQGGTHMARPSVLQKTKMRAENALAQGPAKVIAFGAHDLKAEQCKFVL